MDGAAQAGLSMGRERGGEERKGAMRLSVEMSMQPEVPAYSAVEYNMDDVDKELLRHVRSALSQKPRWQGAADGIGCDLYELIMDRLEKEYYFLQMHALLRAEEPGDGEDANDRPCNICGEKETANDNFLVFCDGCDIAVHQACYGIPYIPEDSWLCRTCLLAPSRKIACALCPRTGGAYKQTTSGEWCHVICAMFVPEAKFENAVLLEPIDGIEAARRERRRWRGEGCALCGMKKGVKIACSYAKCPSLYHVGCAAEEELYMDSANLVTYCRKHDPRKLSRDPAMDFASFRDPFKVSRSEGYPQMLHAPAIRGDTKLWMPVQRLSVQLQRVPPAPTDHMVNRVVFNDLRALREKSEPGAATELVLEMCKIWSARRAELNGYPLIKRLRVECASAKNVNVDWGRRDEYLEGIVKHRKEIQEYRREIEEARRKRGVEYLGVSEHEHNGLVLCYSAHQIVGRAKRRVEKEIKRSRSIYRAHEREYSRFRERHGTGYKEMEALLGRLRVADRHGLFEAPVTEEIAPGYFDVVREPVCLRDIAGMIHGLSYRSLGEMIGDVRRMLENCYRYNGKESFVGREGRRLEEAVREVEEKELAEGDLVLARVPGRPYLPGEVVKKIPRELQRRSCANCALVRFFDGQRRCRWVHDQLVKKTDVAGIRGAMKGLNRETGISRSGKRLQRECLRSFSRQEK